MKSRSEKTTDTKNGFSLVETVTALIVLALISSSVLVVIDRCMTSVADSTLRIQAFEVARENMETLLASTSVEESVEYGDSEKYPAIQWQSVVETFYGPSDEKMWVRAVCSAEYTDADGNLQEVELTHWLTDLTKEQTIQLLEQREKIRLAEQKQGKSKKDKDAETEPEKPGTEIDLDKLPPEFRELFQ